MNAQRINTTISYEQWKLATDKGWKWSELIRLGIAAKVEPTVLQQKLQEKEQEFEAYKKAIYLRENARRNRQSWFGR